MGEQAQHLLSTALARAGPGAGERAGNSRGAYENKLKKIVQSPDTDPKVQAKKWTTFQARAEITRGAIIMTRVIWGERFLWSAWSEKASVLRMWHLSKNLNQKQKLAPLGQRVPGRGLSSHAKALRWEEPVTKERRRQGQGEEGQKKPPSL